jgi:hypothetical protein
MNNAQTAATLIEYADRCIAAYDAADPSDRSAAMKTVLSASFHDFSSLKPNLQLGSREKAIFSLDSNPKRHSVLKHVRNARPDIPVAAFIMKFAMPEIIAEKTKEDNTRAARVLQAGKFAVTDTAGFHQKMKELANKLINKEIANPRLAKLIANYNGALRINESEAGSRLHVPVRNDYCVNNHVLVFHAGSKVKEGETTRPAYAKLCLFEDDLTNRLLDLVFESPTPTESIDKMNATEFDMLMQQFGITSFITPLAVARFVPSHFRSLGARFIELLFDNDVAVNSAGSILHITRRCLGHQSCETTQRYISIKCLGELPTKIGCVSHVDQSDLTDGSFVVKLYEESSTKRKRKRRRGKRHNTREGDAASALLMLNKRQCVVR